MSNAMQVLLPFFRSIPRTARSTALRTSTRVARAAVSLNHYALQQAAEQMEIAFHPSWPAVYVHEGARQSLERRLSQIARQPVVLSITDNRHSMIHAARRTGILRVRLHHMFLDAPDDAIDALARFLLFKDRSASAIVGRYIDINAPRIRTLEPHRKSMKAQGVFHDLQAIYDEINHQYFHGEVEARICWGTEATLRRRRRTTIKLGSYTAQERLIRIHPKLDQEFVPRYFIAYVVYHEMLHHVMPATRVAGRRKLHPPQFRARERLFRHRDRAVAWEATNLDRLLR